MEKEQLLFEDTVLTESRQKSNKTHVNPCWVKYLIKSQRQTGEPREPLGCRYSRQEGTNILSRIGKVFRRGMRLLSAKPGSQMQVKGEGLQLLHGRSYQSDQRLWGSMSGERRKQHKLAGSKVLSGQWTQWWQNSESGQRDKSNRPVAKGWWRLITDILPIPQGSRRDRYPFEP